jgi:hypothetical protein
MHILMHDQIISEEDLNLYFFEPFHNICCIFINKMDIPLHLASASVRALTNLYFFLKHKAKKGDLIIIVVKY